MLVAGFYPGEFEIRRVVLPLKDLQIFVSPDVNPLAGARWVIPSPFIGTPDEIRQLSISDTQWQDTARRTLEVWPSLEYEIDEFGVLQVAVVQGVSGPASGDLSGTYPGPVVSGLQGRTLDSGLPNLGDVITWNGQVWAPIAPSGGAPSGPASGDLTGTYPSPTVSQVQGRPVSSAAPTSNQVLLWNGAQWQPSAVPGAPPSGSASGDLTGTYPNPEVAAIRGNQVVAGIPTNGQIMTWSTLNSRFEYVTPPSPPLAGYDISILTTMATNETVNTRDVDVLVGGNIFDPSLITAPVTTIEFYFTGYVFASNFAEIRLYAINDPGPDVLRSVISITPPSGFTSSFEILTTDVSPSFPNEIIPGLETYEVRIYLSGNPGDFVQVLSAGIRVNANA